MCFPGAFVLGLLGLSRDRRRFPAALATLIGGVPTLLGLIGLLLQ